MSILKIARMGHPVLMQPSAVVEDPLAPEIKTLVSDMIETMEDAGGVGLAAPQVHVGLRVVVFRLPAERTHDGQGQGETVLINPEITPVGDEFDTQVEGCLSLPGMAGRVRRSNRIIYRATGLDGTAFEREATGFHARVVQHECDHLDGILYPQRMDDLGTFGFVEELQKSID